jgi:hypothetical protein
VKSIVERMISNCLKLFESLHGQALHDSLTKNMKKNGEKCHILKKGIVIELKVHFQVDVCVCE